MTEEKRNRVVLALKRADINDDELVAAGKLLEPRRTELYLVHVAERPAVAGAGRGTLEKHVLDAESSHGTLHAAAPEEVCAAKARDSVRSCA